MENGAESPARPPDAVQEGAGEQVIGKYKKFVEDYYRSLAEQASEEPTDDSSGYLRRMFPA